MSGKLSIRQYLNLEESQFMFGNFNETVSKALLDHSLYAYVYMDVSLVGSSSNSKEENKEKEPFDYFIDFLSQRDLDKVRIHDLDIFYVFEKKSSVEACKWLSECVVQNPKMIKVFNWYESSWPC